MNTTKMLPLLLALGLFHTAALAKLTPTALLCDYAPDPLGVDDPQPRLSWQVASQERDQRQTAYQVRVAASRQALRSPGAELWDSGRVASGETLQIRYAGRPLASSQQAFWSVRVWDQDGVASDWSEPAAWTMGILNPSDWHARWIGAADTNLPGLLLRREVSVKPGLKRALIHVCGLGQHELFVNGKKSGAALLAPGWTQYDKTCLYETHDVTGLVREGGNALGISLGNGMYRVPGGRYVKFKGTHGPLQAIGQLRLEYGDGTTEVIGTDATWRVDPGPLTFTCVYGGEDYDARKLPAGWDRPGFDQRAWATAVETSGPGGVLRGHSHSAPPLQAIETITPVSRKPLTNGMEIIDLGQNAPIMPRIRVKGAAGAKIRLTPAELLKPDGTVDRRSAGGGKAYWEYTLSGKGTESWFPQFFYHGCRYLQVERLPASEGGPRPALLDLTGVVVHTASAPVGDFACSNELFNRTRTLIRWAQRANLVSLISDCPHRERLGWLEQYHLNGPSLRYEFDLAQLFNKCMDDMRDAQLPNGMMTSIAPEYTVFGKGPEDETNPFRNSPEWGSAVVLVPWQQYEFTGDDRLLRDYYEPMKAYAAYLESKAQGEIVDFGLGDWYDIGPKPPGVSQLTPRALTATAFYYYDTWVLAETARLLGKEDEAKTFAAKADRIRQAFNTRFFDAKSRSYATGSQCANAIPLVMNLCAPEQRGAVLDALVRDIQSRSNAVTAGDVGYRYVLRALADGGRSDVIHAMNNQSEKPGYGYQLAQGATSLTEAWDARPSSSQNHFMLGQIMEWFYGGLAGIQPDPTGPGFRHLIVKPEPVGEVTWARASYLSLRGRIATHWQRNGDEFRLRVTIPANTRATVYLPAAGLDRVTEGRRPLGEQKGIQFLRLESGRAVLRVGSGEYDFRSKL